MKKISTICLLFLLVFSAGATTFATVRSSKHITNACSVRAKDGDTIMYMTNFTVYIYGLELTPEQYTALAIACDLPNQMNDFYGMCVTVSNFMDSMGYNNWEVKPK